MDALKADIRAKLTADAEKTTKQEKENAVIDKLVEDTEIDVPDCMVDSRVESIIRENNMRMAQQGLTFEQYLSFMGSDVEQFKVMMRPNALKQVKANLILEAIVKKESFDVTDAMADDKIKEMAENFHMEADKLKENLREQDIENIKEDMKMEMAVAMLVDSAKWSKATKSAAKTTTKSAEAKTTTKTASKTGTKTASKSTTSKTAAKSTTAKSTTKSTAAKSTAKAADKAPAKTTKKTTTKKTEQKDAEV